MCACVCEIERESAIGKGERVNECLCVCLIALCLSLKDMPTLHLRTHISPTVIFFSGENNIRQTLELS